MKQENQIIILELKRDNSNMAFKGNVEILDDKENSTIIFTKPNDHLIISKEEFEYMQKLHKKQKLNILITKSKLNSTDDYRLEVMILEEDHTILSRCSKFLLNEEDFDQAIGFNRVNVLINNY